MSVWVYVGPGDGKNVNHRVIFADRALDEIVTVPAEELGNEKLRKHSWLGPFDMFRSHFNFVSAAS